MNKALVILLGSLIFSWGVDCCLAQPGKESKRSPKKSPSLSGEASVATNAVLAGSSQKLIVTEKTLYEEIVQILQSRYADPSLLETKKLNQAAISGVLSSLKGSAQLMEAESKEAKLSSPSPSIHSVSILDSFIGYLRIEKIDDESAKQLEVEIQKLLKEKHASGMIVDLRFAHGTNYASVPVMAASFLPTTKPLFNIQRGSLSQAYMTSLPVQTTDIPLVVLVNQETREAAEVLAAVLQDQKRAVVIGNSSTAGQAFETSEVKLSNGQILKFATGKIFLSGGESLFLKSVPLDVCITFDQKLEKEIYQKPFQPPAFKTETRMYSEAILTGRETPPPIKIKSKAKDASEVPSGNHDLVLLRAIDLLKSIQALGLS